MRNPIEKIYILFVFSISVLATGLPAVSAQDSGIYNVIDYGGIGDGETLNTSFIQKAIDLCNKNGGGIVEFTAGTYLTGTIVMKDNVILHLQAGSKILGSTNISDYPMYSPPIPNNMDKDVKRALIRGENLKNIGITGSGIIDGQGKSLQGIKIDDEALKEIERVYTDKTRYIPGKKNDQRPFLMRFVSCKNIAMNGITLQHPGKWTQHYLNCDGITIRDVEVFAHGGENNDMIDIDGSKNVVITGMRGDSDDDGICLKSAGNQIVENVLISDCILRSRTNAIKTGTDSYGGFKNITITNCYIGPSITNEGYSGRDEGLAGIALELVDGGVLENVTISNIVMEEMAAPVFIRLGNRGRTPKPNMEPRPVGVLNNISISNIVARNAGRTGCSIIGEIDHPITNISISNIRINFDGGGTLSEALEEKQELVNEYPESTKLGNLPAYGFFVRHVDGITFRDVDLSYNEEEGRPAMLFNDVQNLKLLNFDAEIKENAKAQVILQNTTGVFVNGCSPKASSSFLSIERNSKDINVLGNNLKGNKKPIIIDETIETKGLSIASNLTGKTTLFEFLQPNIERDSLGMVYIYYPNNTDVYYTNDGTHPTKSSKKYIKPFEQIEATTIMATAFDKDKESGTAILKLEKALVLAPQIFLKDQFFNKRIDVKLESNTKGATVYYTLDGNKPNMNSLKYVKPIQIHNNAVLRTVAVKEGFANSLESNSKYKSIEKLKGVQYKYYDLKTEKLPNYMNLIPKRAGVIKKFSLDGIEQSEFNFALIFHAYLKVEKEGEYSFYLSSNDGSKLFIDHKEIVNNDGTHGSIEKSEKVKLNKGLHLIEVRYFQAGGVKSLKVSWQGPGFNKHEIDQHELSK